MFDFDILKRLFSWLAAINAIITVIVVQLTPLAVDYPTVAQVLSVLVTVSAIITPFLPRAQGSGEGK